MKILHIITELGGGGAEKVLAMLTAEQQKAGGHTVSVLSLQCPPENPEIPERLAASGCTVQYLNAKKHDPFLVLKLRSFLRRTMPDLIHTHLIHPNLLSRLAAAGLHIPLLNTVHTAEKRKGKGLYFLLDRLTFFLTDGMTAVSGVTAQFHEKRCHFPAHTLSVIGNGLDPVEPAPETECAALRQTLGIGNGERIIACIGRMDAMKGFQYLPERMRAVSSVIPENEKWVILIFGDGPYRKELEQTPPLPNLRIICAGYRKDAARWLGMAEVYLSMSLCEGCSLAAAEAMTFGLPFVCNNADTMQELCNAYAANTFLFDLQTDRDGTQLAAQLARAMQCGKSAGTVLHSVQDMAQEYEEAYRNACKKNAARPLPFLRLRRIFALTGHCLRICRYVKKHNGELSDLALASCVQRWAAGILNILNIRLEVTGSLPENTGFLLVSNHQSYLDIPVHGAVCKNIRFTPNNGIRNWLLFGKMVQLSRPVWIDRTSPAKAKQSLADFRRTLQDGLALVIYPEGTTTSGTVPLLPFKSTAFESVLNTEIPVVPVLTAYSAEGGFTPAWFDNTPFLLHVFRLLGCRGMTVRIKILPPLTAAGQDRKALAKTVREILENARKESIV